jgi:hypothetical protein
VRRHDFIALFSSAATWPLAAGAQQPVVGFLSSSSPHPCTPFVAAFRGGPTMKNLLIGIAVGFGCSVAFFTLMANPRTSLAPPEMSYSQFIADVDGGKIEEVTFQGSKIVGRFTTGHTFRTLAPHSQLLPALTDL